MNNPIFEIKRKQIIEITSQKLWLAPLAGYTDKNFRIICKQNGADVMVSEMVSADGLVYGQSRTSEYMIFSAEQRPFGIQLFGSSAEIMAEAAKIAAKLNPDFIDLNMGCPVKKVILRGAGSALMQNESLAFEIVKAVKASLINTSIPLTVKIRSGWDYNSINALKFAQMIEDAGADAVCVHPRTRSQMFSGRSDWAIIKNIKKLLSIPVIGNGDILSLEDAVEMYETTGCDSIMIGRGALGRPWIFGEIKNGLGFNPSYKNTSSEKIPIFNNQMKLNYIIRHLESAIAERGEERGIIEMRAHLAFYTKGMNGASKVREFINYSTSYNEIIGKIAELFNER
ncbi:MAG: tRNA dihydrouridine synthase DusB [Candidatus Cloacimonetes bacterium]|nr:tRNA dihydrouridine synthase DusB [Candidatus Cloacimonadota bacterium]